MLEVEQAQMNAEAQARLSELRTELGLATPAEQTPGRERYAGDGASDSVTVPGPGPSGRGARRCNRVHPGRDASPPGSRDLPSTVISFSGA